MPRLGPYDVGILGCNIRKFPHCSPILFVELPGSLQIIAADSLAYPFFQLAFYPLQLFYDVGKPCIDVAVLRINDGYDGYLGHRYLPVFADAFQRIAEGR